MGPSSVGASVFQVLIIPTKSRTSGWDQAGPESRRNQDHWSLGDREISVQLDIQTDGQRQENTLLL